MKGDETPIVALGLSTRSLHSLQIGGVATVAELVRLTSAKVVRLRGLGTSSLEDIKAKLATYASSGLPVAATPEKRRFAVERSYTLAELISEWLEKLDDRTRTVVRKRYGLEGQAQTLATIGEEFGITRARVDQLLNKAFRKLKRLDRGKPLAACLRSLRQFVAQKGGLASADELRKGLGGSLDLGGFDPVLACQMLADVDERVKWMGGLQLLGDGTASPAQVMAVRREVRKLVLGGEETLDLLLLACGASSSFCAHCGDPDDEFILACLRTDPSIQLVDGILRRPERTTTHVQRIMAARREISSPAHYREIAERLSASQPEDERLTRHSVHALMQRYPRVFARVGRGVYGLTEWGMLDDGNVAEAIDRALREAGRSLPMDEIVRCVLATCHVSPTTVSVALGQDRRFQRVGKDSYGLAEWGSPVRDTVAYVICEVLRACGEPLAAHEIASRVRVIRPAAPTTVAFILAKDPRFIRVRPGFYGLAEWGDGVGSSVADAVCQALREADRPLALSEIERYISITCPGVSSTLAVVAAREPRLRHMGRGVYGLAEWGLPDEGSMADAVWRVLREQGQPLSVSEIEERMLGARSVAYSTLYNALTKDPRFVRVRRGTYGLTEWEAILSDRSICDDVSCAVG
jgi:hypothetical protein